jgi:signal transduction histidine kinase
VRTGVEYRSFVIQRGLVRAREHVFDAAVAAVLVATQIQVWRHEDHPHRSLAVMALAVVAPLFFRRLAPLGAVLASALGIYLFTLVDPGGAYDTSSMFFALLVACWAAGSILDGRRAALGFAAILVGGWLVMARAPGVPWTEVLWVTLPLSGVFVLSVAATRKLQAVREAEERARRSEEEARRAVEEERARITRELHDVLAHSVSVMTVQASAVRRLLTPEQEREREALLTVEETGRQALAEMRRLLGIMRHDSEPAARAPQPGLGTLPALLEQVRQSGLPVELTIEGTPVQLPPAVDLSAYRIVQEALTNTLRHAGPAHAWVAVRYGGEDVEIEVANDGKDAAEKGAGHGLVGMRERAAVCGGELVSGPRPGGGFQIAARLPVAGGAA